MDEKKRSLRSIIEDLRRSGGSVEEAVNTLMYSESPLFKRAGLRVVRVDDGIVEVAFDMVDEIKRRGGVVHGGVIMYVLDSVCGLAVMSRSQGVDQFTVELKVNFLEPLKDPPFRAMGRVLRMGGRIAVAQGEVLDGGGKLCAAGLGTWYIVGDSSSPPQR